MGKKRRKKRKYDEIERERERENCYLVMMKWGRRVKKMMERVKRRWFWEEKEESSVLKPRRMIRSVAFLEFKTHRKSQNRVREMGIANAISKQRLQFPKSLVSRTRNWNREELFNKRLFREREFKFANANSNQRRTIQKPWFRERKIGFAKANLE